MTTKISIIIPALNEERGIRQTILAISRRELEEMGYEVQILVIDGNSQDKTRELAQEAGAEVILEPRCGYGRAYKTGFAHAKGEIIATADADGSYSVQAIPKLVQTLETKNLEFITTNRFPLMESRAMSPRNKLGNYILFLAIRFCFGLNMRDPESGMWVFKKDILNKLRLGSDSWPFSHELKIEACYYNKCRWKEVPIQYKTRLGKTKLVNGWKVGFTDLYHIMRKRVIR